MSEQKEKEISSDEKVVEPELELDMSDPGGEDEVVGLNAEQENQQLRGQLAELISSMSPGDESIKLQLQLDEANKTMEQLKKEGQVIKRKDWKREALKEFPLADASQIRGRTRKEIRLSAKKSHDFVEEIKDRLGKDLKKELEDEYGKVYASPPGEKGTKATYDEELTKQKEANNLVGVVNLLLSNVVDKLKK